MLAVYSGIKMKGENYALPDYKLFSDDRVTPGSEPCRPVTACSSPLRPANASGECVRLFGSR